MNLQDWIGRSETVEDTATATPYAALAAMLDRSASQSPIGAVAAAGPQRPPAGTPLPCLWHWLYFLPIAPQRDIGEDGHPKRGGFMPPVPLPRRMWASSDFEWREPLQIGDALTRTSIVIDVKEKSGRTGSLIFVKVRHEIRRNGAPAAALIEHHNIVYRAAASPSVVAPPPQAAPAAWTWERRIVPDDVLLFRYSALTFNSHRIHYDRNYATRVEGYPGLVVHGPLIATLLLDLLRRQMPDAQVAGFRFRAVRPSFDLHPLQVSGAPQPDGKTVRLWAQDHDGWLTMDATATLR